MPAEEITIGPEPRRLLVRIDLDRVCVRDTIGPVAVVGLSIENVGQFARVPRDAVDHPGAGPAFGTAAGVDHAEGVPRSPDRGN